MVGMLVSMRNNRTFLSRGRIALMMPLWSLGTSCPLAIAEKANQAPLEAFLQSVKEFNQKGQKEDEMPDPLVLIDEVPPSSQAIHFRYFTFVGIYQRVGVSHAIADAAMALGGGTV